MTRTYEVLVIIKTVGSDQELAQVVSRLEEPIKKLGGTIAHSANLGRRRLAFKIGQSSEGFYQLCYFQVPPAGLDELKRLWRLNEHVVRFLVLQSDGVPAQPLQAVTTEAVYGQSQPSFSHR